VLIAIPDGKKAQRIDANLLLQEIDLTQVHVVSVPFACPQLKYEIGR
jgi:hypothetical protein